MIVGKLKTMVEHRARQFGILNTKYIDVVNNIVQQDVHRLTYRIHHYSGQSLRLERTGRHNEGVAV